MNNTHADVSAEQLLVCALAEKGLKISAAESCTGGYIAKRITDVAGASSVLEGSIVTYANRVKERFTGVKRKTLKAHGAVSPETAAEMARGVRKLFGAHIGIAATGIAGPDGGTPEKPVGLVYVAVSSELYEEVVKLTFDPALDRETIRYNSATEALTLALKAASIK